MVLKEDTQLICMKKIGLKVLFMLMCSPRARDKELKHLHEFLSGIQFLLETIASISIEEIADKIKNIGMQNRNAFYIQQTFQKIKHIWDGCIPHDSKVLKTCNGICMKIALLVVQYVYGIVQVCTNLQIMIIKFSITNHSFLFCVLRGFHVINWANVMNWIADPNAKHSAEFVCLSLQSWIPRYQWKNVNPSLASLAQVMGI